MNTTTRMVHDRRAYVGGVINTEGGRMEVVRVISTLAVGYSFCEVRYID